MKAWQDLEGLREHENHKWDFWGGLREHILEYNLEHICKTNLKLDLKRVRTVWYKYEWKLRKA